MRITGSKISSVPLLAFLFGILLHPLPSASRQNLNYKNSPGSLPNVDPGKTRVAVALETRPYFPYSPMNDDNFNVEGVTLGIYKEEALKLRYPDCGYDFPAKIRRDAYDFVDKVLNY